MESGDGAGLGFIFLVVAIAGYFLPGIIASMRGHESQNMIAFLNLILGWTVIGWLVLLVVAFTGTTSSGRKAREEELALLRKIAASKD